MASTPRSPGRAAEPAVVAAAIGVSLIAWAWLWHMPSASATNAAWTATDAALTFAMWIVMMVAMMAGPVSPALQLFAGMQRTRAGSARGAVPMFASGYALVWIGFSAAATLAQWLLDRAAMLTPDMALANARIGGAVLVLAGAYAFTPLSDACLRQCQSPLGFFMTHWRDGALGALRMGARHGLHCVGCCWALMAILFAVGVMNLAWVALLTLVVLIQKLSAASAWTARVAGAAIALAGLAMMLSPG
jgi:predicted metal-binding membrane protein